MAHDRSDPASHPLAFVDLFCGAGGISEGFRQFGWTPAAGTDIDPDAVATYGLNFPEAQALSGDLRDRNLMDELLAHSRDVDVVVGGPPCQGFSQVRNHARLIEDPKNSLYREFVDFVDRVKPKAFVMENVPGMSQMGVLEQVEEDLGCSGRYKVTSMLIDAADFGVPQSRKRLIFVGIHADLRAELPPLEGSRATSTIRLQRLSNGRVDYVVSTANNLLTAEVASALADPWDLLAVSVDQAIGDLADLRVGTNRVDELPASVLRQPQSAYQKMMRKDVSESMVSNVGVPRMREDTRLRLDHIPPGGNYLDLTEELQDRYLTGERWGQHNGSQRLSRRHYYAYRRLHPEIWSWTINTKADSVYHWSTPRALSVREFGRLQSFPDTFVFTTDPRKGPLPGRIAGGPGHSRYRQAGNAVPPLLARSIAEALDPLVS